MAKPSKLNTPNNQSSADLKITKNTMAKRMMVETSFHKRSCEEVQVDVPWLNLTMICCVLK